MPDPGGVPASERREVHDLIRQAPAPFAGKRDRADFHARHLGSARLLIKSSQADHADADMLRMTAIPVDPNGIKPSDHATDRSRGGRGWAGAGALPSNGSGPPRRPHRRSYGSHATNGPSSRVPVSWWTARWHRSGAGNVWTGGLLSMSDDPGLTPITGRTPRCLRSPTGMRAQRGDTPQAAPGAACARCARRRPAANRAAGFGTKRWSAASLHHRPRR